MNIYLIKDGGDDKLWKAETFEAALKAAEDAYIRENMDALDNPEPEEREHYRNSVVESCALLGELGNP